MFNKQFLFSIIFSCLAVGVFALAASAPVQLVNPITTDNFCDFTKGLIRFLFILSVYIAIIVIPIAGLYMVLSGTGIDPKPVEKAKSLIKYAIIGLIIMLMANALSDLFFNKLGIIKNC